MNTKGTKLALGVVIIVVCLILLNPFTASAIWNNYSLNRYKGHLSKYPTPPHTYRIDSYSKVGGIEGNGDNCDFVAGITYETDLTSEEIEQYYANLEMPAARGKGKVAVSLYFKEVKYRTDKLVYEIQILDEGYSPLLDIRCV